MFGEMLRAHRQRLALTQEELAEAAGLSVRSIGKLESGRIRSPRSATVRLLARALGLSGPEWEAFHHGATAGLTAGMTAGMTAGPSVAGVALAQLPRDTPVFIGRKAELEQLEELLGRSDRPALPSGGSPSGAAVVWAISGPAGVGKTAMAVHAAHRVAARYPDGQVFVNLHGFTLGVPPDDPIDVLGRLLRMVGVPDEEVPKALEDRAGLWRSLLARRRMLILLDNAIAGSQVAPLLPGATDSVVVVTSRRRLPDLDASISTDLGALPKADAVTLFARVTGREWLSADALAAEAVDLCGCLPLAVRIAGARLSIHHTWTLAHLVERLRVQDRRLAELSDESGSRSVTAALDLSCQQLSTEQRFMYHVLGWAGADVDAFAAAALVGTGTTQAVRLLEGLLDAHLLQEPTPGRYAFHDLVGDHARQAMARELAEPARQAALRRLLDYYRDTAAVAMDVAYPYEGGHQPKVPAWEGSTPDLFDPTAASAWLESELTNLVTVTQRAADHDSGEHLLHLAAILRRHLRTRSRFGDAAVLHRQAIEVASRMNDSAGEADAWCELGHAHRMVGRYAEAMEEYRRGLEIAQETGDRAAEAKALCGSGRIHYLHGDHDQAASGYRRVLDIARAAGDRTHELEALCGLGQVHRLQGRYTLSAASFRDALEVVRVTGNRSSELEALIALGDIELMHQRDAAALERLRPALDISRTIGNRVSELHTLVSLAQVYRRQGRHGAAIDSCQRALEISRAVHSPTGQLDALTNLGDIYRRQDQLDAAADHYRQALRLAEELPSGNWQFEAHQGLGRVHHAAGEPEAALARHQRALELATDLGQPTDQARAHDGLAHAYVALNQPEQARHHWCAALDLLESVSTGVTDEETVNVPALRAHVAGLSAVHPPN